MGWRDTIDDFDRNDWLKLVAGVAGTAAGFGLAGMGPLAALAGEGAAAAGAAGAGAGAAGAAEGAAMSTGLLGTLGGMGTEQAALLAAQNAGLGVGADIATLNAAATAGGGWATPWAVAGKVAKGANIANKAMGVMQAGQQQQRAAPPPLPLNRGPWQGPSNMDILTAGGKAPSAMDPAYLEYLRRLYGY